MDQPAFEDAFGALPPADFQARYNIAPTQPAPVVRPTGGDGVREAVELSWGFQHVEPGKRTPLINARVETAAEKRSFGESFRHQRCLVPADGYYEWTGSAAARRPILLRAVNGPVMGFAGLWQADGEDAGRFTILTTAASEAVALIHDRMPVVLPVDLHDSWLDSSLDDSELIGELLRQVPPPLLTTTPVSRFVNSVANEGPECWGDPERDRQANLF